VRLPISRLGGDVTGSVRDAGDRPVSLVDSVRVMAARPAGALSSVMDSNGEDGIRILLRHAGRDDITAESYRWLQLVRAGAAGAAGALLGAVVGAGRGAPISMAMMGAAAGVLVGSGLWRSQLRKQARQRTERIGLEVYAVAHLLAMLARANHGPLASVRRVVARGAGPLIEELERVLASIAGGARTDQAFDRGASELAHPGAARLFRLLGQSATTGGDLAPALRALSEQLRNERRTDLEQAATKRRGAMVVPTIVLMVPVVLLYLIAPIPNVVFGRGEAHDLPTPVGGEQGAHDAHHPTPDLHVPVGQTGSS
jgi:Type II secretion system (T2SS), protein F